MTHSILAKNSKGFVLGKFMPPHHGHQFLVDFARGMVDQLVIVVGSLPDEPIPGELRYQWMKQLYPDCKVVHLDAVLPQYPQEAASEAEFWDLWRSHLQALLPWPVDFVFASEDYGLRLAQELNARFVPMNQSRQLVPISGTEIRQAPFTHWEYLPELVRPYFVKKICLFGPESTGKSTLAKKLASHFNTHWVPEYAQSWMHYRRGQVALEDMPVIVKGQLASEASLLKQANRYLFCDTDVLTSILWSEELFGQVEDCLWQFVAKNHYDLTLLCSSDVPWVDDLHRLRPNNRQQFFERCQQILEKYQRPYTVLSGSWDERWEQALQKIVTEDVLDPVYDKAKGPHTR